jgi:hypothetical protein
MMTMIMMIMSIVMTPSSTQANASQTFLKKKRDEMSRQNHFPIN